MGVCGCIFGWVSGYHRPSSPGISAFGGELPNLFISIQSTGIHEKRWGTRMETHADRLPVVRVAEILRKSTRFQTLHPLLRSTIGSHAVCFVCVCVRVWRLVIPLRCCPATGMAWKPYGKANPKRPGALDGPAGDVMDRLTVVRPRVTYMGIVMDSLYQHPTLQVTTRDFKVSKSHQRRPVGGSWYMYIIL